MESPSMNGGPHARASSPPSCFSILITSAPMSPRIMPAIGPATACAISITFIPASGPVMACSPESDRRIPRNRQEPIFVAVLLDVADRGEGEVEADHKRLLGRCHVMEFVPGGLRLHRIDVV